MHLVLLKYNHKNTSSHISAAACLQNLETEVLQKRFILYSNTCTRSNTVISLPKTFLTDYTLLISIILIAAEKFLTSDPFSE